MEILKRSIIRKMLPQRKPDSHKGENGRVLIIGGSMEFFGAPILAGLGALYSGCDLVTLLTPECNFDVSRSFYPDFIVRKYGGFHLNLRVLDVLNPLLDKTDCLIIGPGLTEGDEVLHVVKKILDKVDFPVVLDADALPAIHALKPKSTRPLVLTPHAGEFNDLIDETFSNDLRGEEKIALLAKYAEMWNATILLKGRLDFIASPASPSQIILNETGNPGMTVGGTGDVLAGITASFIAQGAEAFEACCLAAYINGYAGDMLQENKGYAYSATDVALELPYVIKNL